PSKVVMPTASCPRCCNACRPRAHMAAASLAPMTPKMPHSSRSLSLSASSPSASCRRLVRFIDPLWVVTGPPMATLPGDYKGGSPDVPLTKGCGDVRWEPVLAKEQGAIDHAAPRSATNEISNDALALSREFQAGRTASARLRSLEWAT